MTFFKKIEENYPPLVFAVIYTIIFSAATILRYETFHASYMDFGAEMHNIYRIAHGHFMSYGTHIFYGSGYLEPLYFFLGFLYKIIPHVSLFLILQSFLIGISAFPFYWLYKDIIGKNGAYLAPLLLLLNPQLHTGNMFDFHVSVFYVPFISFALYFAKKKQNLLLYIFFFLILITKIDSFIYATGVCIFMFLTDYRNKHAYVLAVISIIYGLSAIFIMLPHMNYDTYKALVTNGGSYMDTNRFPMISYGLKDLYEFNFSGLLKSIFLPFYNNITIYFKFVLFLFLAFLLLPLFSGRYFLIIIPALMMNLLVNYSFQSEFILQYSFYVIPFFVLASIYGIKNLKQSFLVKKLDKNSKLFNFTLLAMLIVIPYIIQNYSQLNYNVLDNIFNLKIYKLDKNIDIKSYKTALKKIPEDSVTSVSMFAYPWDFKEKKVYLFPQINKNVRYIIISTCVYRQMYHRKDKKLIKDLDGIINKGKFKIIYNSQCNFILKRINSNGNFNN
ncbi:MAG: DUF2079 domain-containing protein [Candidatus Acididesulfobacter guangdongensis]|uniref:DUF2079 domain-containing protein n=1 Tax=Acididesulfobacter guangdongensis TaxID=2597225 RepID=A0A519BHZ1_ACIG2|nr:MAG: DUF2079 domain-containing protein [Candidatus Acididesulfobacter guangdongensis]